MYSTSPFKQPQSKYSKSHMAMAWVTWYCIPSLFKTFVMHKDLLFIWSEIVVCMQVTSWGQRRVSDHLNQELQKLWAVTWVPDSKLGLLQEQWVFSTSEPSLQPLSTRVLTLLLCFMILLLGSNFLPLFLLVNFNISCFYMSLWKQDPKNVIPCFHLKMLSD